MQKDQSQKQTEKAQPRILPTLTKTQTTLKNLITSTKLEIDQTHHLANKSIQRKSYQQPITTISYKRLIKQISIHVSHSQFPKFHKKFQQPTPDSKKIQIIATSKPKTKSTPVKQLMTQSQLVSSIDKSKISIKQIGYIKGYAVNSHPGPLSTINEDRICVVTNLNKYLQKKIQISFFSIYDGTNGTTKAEYFRDNFHTTLTKDKNFYKDIQTSIKKTFLQIQQLYKKNYQKPDNSSVSALIAIIIDNEAYIASLGQNKTVISINYGSQLINPLTQTQVKKKTMIKSQCSSIYNSNLPNIKVIKISLNTVDFMVLGSEGLFEFLDEVLLAKKVWTNLILHSQEQFHSMLGQTTNAILSEIFQYSSTKNVSMILLTFTNIQQSFQTNNFLQLPHVVAPNFVELSETI